MAPPIRRLFAAFSILLLLIASGGAGYYVLGGGRWSFSDCIFMTVITLSTVGFGELNQMGDVPGARLLTILLIVSGVGTLAYVQGNLTALFVEGVFGQAFRKNRMRKAIGSLSGHIVVAGAGSTGMHVIEELVATQTPFVVIDANRVQLLRIDEELCHGKLLFIVGDATNDHTLLEANIGAAQGVVAALTHDKDNLFVTLSARSLNPSARIVTKVVEDAAAPKMLKAGATATVSPTQIGGRRMASELVRPEVTEFLDQMLRDKDKALRIEEVPISAGSKMGGLMLKDTPIRRETRLLVVAVRAKDRTFMYNPEPDFKLESGMTLIVMGDPPSVAKLRGLVG
ncbi:MAG: potassium channel protein [Polyangiaceae bacterium]